MSSNYIVLNGVRFDLNKSKSMLMNELPDWERDIYSFLVEWFSESEHISVQTSGSTGKPKIISKKKSTLINSAVMTGKFFHFAENQTALLCLPAKFVAGKMMLVRAIEWGLELDYIAPKIQLQIPEKAYFFSAMTPQQVEGSLSKLGRISNLIIGGAPIPITLEKELVLLDTNCYATYGMTETVSHIALREISVEPNSAYQILEGISIKTDTRDCLKIDAPKLLNESITTNDIVELTSPTSFIWKGRYDNVVNTGGVKVFPEVIETKIASIINSPIIITGVPSKKWGDKLILIVETVQLDTEELSNQLNTILTKTEIPKSIFLVSKFIRTENGKINRKQTLDLLPNLRYD
jgi:O-succinylbenzoic acid--CoA ligase